MVFSPLNLASLVVIPLRYFFANYAASVQLTWSSDPKQSQIEIGTVNDFNTIEIQQKPRILIDRGDYILQKTGLTDNMMSEPGVKASFGEMHRQNLIFIMGNMTITVEAVNEGTCELVTDMVTHFLAWTRPMLCDSQGFKEFGMPMTISKPSVQGEDKEKFSVQISIPYSREEDWTVDQDAIKIKNIFTNISNLTPNTPL